MRRSIVPMFTLAATLSTSLAAQSALAVGLASTLGSNFQIEAAEFGFMHRVGLGPLQAVGASVRAGWFADQAAIIGGTRGFVGGGALAVRSARVGVAEIGEEMNPTRVGLDLTLEVAGYLSSNSPLPEGNHWMSAAVLPGLWVGQAGGSQFAILLGPAWFAGRVRRTHAFLGIRVEIPLARGEGGP